MSRYIEVDKAIEALYRYSFVTKKTIEEDIRAIPTTDIVRCKSCRHWAYGKDLCTLHDMGMMSDDFCSYGEKSDE